MSLEDIDLNIDNYSLDDLLQLFKLPLDFHEEDLKRAKRLVLMTHPDKSNLKKEVFLFLGKLKLYSQVNLSS